MNFLNKEYSQDKFKRIPILILFNKIDLNPNFDLENHMQLFTPEISNLNLRYATTSVKNGEGLSKNFSWLIKGIKVSEAY
jgi:signal recognition particle receptor subunit beta